jgi:urea transport system ATP-binding protein
MLQLNRIDSFYGASQILHGVTTEIADGLITAVLGRNGTGKTTLLKTIMGLTDRMAGNLRLGDRDLTTQPTFMRARSGIAYVPQGREIIPNFTVKENILMGCFARAGGQQQVPDLVPQLFPYLMENLNRQGGLLSGGQQQQLAIARALAAKPSILLLDEPTEGIQPNIVEEIQNIIIRLNEEVGLTIILVEQNVAFAVRAAKKFLMMEKGRFVASGTTEDLTQDLIHRHLSV